jgi:RHS repeat-associated protein
VLTTGDTLLYEPVRYDGGLYPAAPAGAATNIFAFLLRSVHNANGYLTCFANTHFGDVTFGRAAVFSEITYGPALKDCAAPPAAALTDHVVLRYVDPTAAGEDYYAPTSWRFGAPASFNNLLVEIELLAEDDAASATGPHSIGRYTLHHAPAISSETRLPRLDSLVQHAPPVAGVAIGQSRVLRQFRYGSRATSFGSPQLIDVGADSRQFPRSLSGSISRAVLSDQVLGNAYGLFGLGHDQVDAAAPVSPATTERWSMLDLNGDGLLDVLMAHESGAPGTSTWSTFEHNAAPGARPAQQWALINEGIQNDTLGSTQVLLDTRAPVLEASRSPTAAGIPGMSPWIWQEGLGMTRTGMSVSVSSPEVRSGGRCPPTGIGQDTRVWPYLPDGTFGGSQGSVGEQLATATIRPEIEQYSANINLITGVTNAFIPRHSVSASLSGWVDLDGDGLVDWVVTPGMLERFDKPLVCLGFAHVPEAAGTDWFVARGQASLGLNSTAVLVAQPTPGPAGPVGEPLSFAVDAGQSEEFGLTIPIGGLISAAASIANPAPSAWPYALAALVADAVTPRGEPGIAASVALNLPSPTATTGLLRLATVKGGPNAAQAAEAAGDFVMSMLGINLDITLRSGGNRGRSQSRAELMDFDADGLPDYWLYDSPTGAIKVFRNLGASGFAAPVRINTGYDYSTPSVTSSLATDASTATSTASKAKITALPICEVALTTGNGSACAGLTVAAGAVAITVANAAATAEPLLTATTDALPDDRAHPGEAKAAAASLAALAIAAQIEYLVPFKTPTISPGILAEHSVRVAQMADLLSLTVRQLDYSSKLNMLSKGGSQLDAGWISGNIGGISAETGGLVDLNGDGLPDYVVTVDRAKSCGVMQWDVYWGTGAANLSVGRGFVATPTCVDVPNSPANVAKRGYATLPMQVEFILRPPASGDTTYHRSFTFVTLLDYNEDGRPDIVVADTSGQWDPADASKVWTVFLNSGRGFDLQRPLAVASVSGTLTDGGPASTPGTPGSLAIAYPGLKSSMYIDTPSLRRSGGDVEAAFVDADGDGVADLARRVWHTTSTTAGTTFFRAGILVWSRAGDGPQDVMLEEREPEAGSRTLVTYLPASQFQWPNGRPTRAPPAGGHRAALGASANLVSAIIREPLIGRVSARSATAFDYKDPYFEPVTRAFAGFGRVTTSPMDPITRSIVAASPQVVAYSAQTDDASASTTHERVVVAGTGAPITEVMHGYARVAIPSFGPARYTPTFAARDRTIRVEFPGELTAAPRLDVSFDGRTPLANRSDRNGASATTSAGASGAPALVFDQTTATGGALVLTASNAQWVAYPSPNIAAGSSLAAFTVETWIRRAPPSGAPLRATIARLGIAYELVIESSGVLRFGVNAGGMKYATAGELAPSRWTHVAASYDGSRARLFVDGRGVDSVVASGVPVGSATQLVVGCTLPASGTATDCFDGMIGELRVYGEAWRSAPRITDQRLELATTLTNPNFGQVIATYERGDVADTTDDVFEGLEYATPVTGSALGGAVAKRWRRVLGPDGVTLGGYVVFETHQYDGLPAGQVRAGNVTRVARYGGVTGVPMQPLPDIFVKTSYDDPACPGVPTAVEDEGGAVTRATFDPTCVFRLTTTNALGHRQRFHYSGVNGDPVPGVEPYGALLLTDDPNGAIFRVGHDVWGRQTTTEGPYSRGRPETKRLYASATCRTNVVGSCGAWKATELASPALVTVETWDPVLHAYRRRYEFGDGQVQTQAVDTGVVRWLVAGTLDFDALGREIRRYKPRYAPSVCVAGQWCDSERLAGDPLRDPATVAHLQLAYDERGRTIRTYEPDVPLCPDPSARVAGGALTCDAIAAQANPVGHFARIEYPAPGVVRDVDVRDVPSVVRRDVHGRMTAAEDYMATSSAPYATVRYYYDRNGNLARVLDDSGNVVVADHDAVGRKVTMLDPDRGAWQMQYDARRNVRFVEDAVGNTATTSYDILGRPERTEHRAPFKTVWRYTFDGSPGDAQLSRPIAISPPPTGSLNQWHTGQQVVNQRAFTPTMFAWDVAALTPLPISAGNLDDGVAGLTLPFDFVIVPDAIWSLYVGQNRMGVVNVPGRNRFTAGSAIWVSANGKIRFDPAGATAIGLTSIGPKPLPTNVPDETAIYAIWSDLVMTGMSSGVVGTAPNRRLIVEWRGTRKANGAQVVVRAVLFEGTFEIQYQYQTMVSGGTIGLQNRVATAPQAAYAILYGSSSTVLGPNAALTSRQTLANGLVAFNNGTTYGLGQRLDGEFAIDVDLTAASEAQLTFLSAWNTRCVNYPLGSCPVDQPSVWYEPTGRPRMLLADQSVLTTNDAITSSQAVGALTPSVGPRVTRAFPVAALGTRGKVILAFSTIDNGTLEPRSGWVVDDIELRTRGLDDIVMRRYDSAEPVAIGAAPPTIDLTLDVPARLVDRAASRTTVNAVNVAATDGQSGWGGELTAASRLDVVRRRRLTARAPLTLMAWVRPSSGGSRQPIVVIDGVAALERDAAGHARCSVQRAGTSKVATGTTFVPETTWTHLALVDNGKAVHCYVNGFDEANASAVGPRPVGNNVTHVGRDAGTARFVGGVDEVKLFLRAVPTPEVLQWALAALSPGPPRGNVLDLRFSDPAQLGADSSLAHNDAATITSRPVAGVQGTSMDFSSPTGTGRFIRVLNSPSLGSSHITAESWLRTRTRGEALVVGKWDGVAPGWRLVINRLSGQVRFEVRTRVQTADVWATWAATMPTGPPVLVPSCATGAVSVAHRRWQAPATGSFSFTSANSGDITAVRDTLGVEVACGSGTISINAGQGALFEIYIARVSGAGSALSVTATGPAATTTSFVSLQAVTDGNWHHIAGTYDGTRIRVYIDGVTALRTCTGVEGGDAVTCKDPPIDVCTSEAHTVVTGTEHPVKHKYGDATCARGHLDNALPLMAGASSPTAPSLDGLLDEIRVSSYAKRDFEVAQSARTAAAYTRALGAAVEVTNFAADRRFNADLEGRQVSATITTRLPVAGSPATESAIRATWDNLGRTTTSRYPDGEVVVSDFDAGGTEIRLTGYGDFAGPGEYGRQPYVTGVDVSSTGRVVRRAFGNGTEERFTYDDGPAPGGATTGAFGREEMVERVTTLASPGLGAPGPVLQLERYRYDAGGNLLQRATRASALHAAPDTSNFTYDDLGRLSTFSTQFGTTPAASGTYTYSPLGNVRTIDGNTITYGAATTPDCPDAGPASRPHGAARAVDATGPTDYCYDENGSLSERRDHGGTLTAAHDARRNLAAITTPSSTTRFQYDGLGERVKRLNGSDVVTMPTDRFRLTPTGPESFYTWSGSRIARRAGPSASQVFWYHTDHLGSTRFMTDAVGAELQDAYSEYLPFGGALNNAVNNTAGTKAGQATPDAAIGRSGGFQFTGAELDPTGLYRFGARYYEPRIARFIEADDRIPGEGSQTLNLYSYALNNPLALVDPTGRSAEEASGAHVHCQSCRLFVAPATDQLYQAQRFVEQMRDPKVGLEMVQNALLAPPPPVYDPGSISAWTVQDNNVGVPNLQVLYGGIQKPLIIATVGWLAAPAGTAAAGAWGFGLVGGAELAHGGFALSQGQFEEAGWAFTESAFDLLGARMAASDLSGGPTAPLRAGRAYEAEVLGELNLSKNNVVWRPDAVEVESRLFREIVGEPRYLESGLLKGTILDAVEGGNLEIKGGCSPLCSTYQLRLQVYQSVKNGVPLTLQTTRPINPTFNAWLQRWGTIIRSAP